MSGDWDCDSHKQRGPRRRDRWGLPGPGVCLFAPLCYRASGSAHGRAAARILCFNELEIVCTGGGLGAIRPRACACSRCVHMRI